MGADAFTGFYGIEEIVSADEADSFDPRVDERIARARQNKLQFHLGRITAGRDYHLLIGKQVVDIGIPSDEEISIRTFSFLRFKLKCARS